MKMHKKLLLVGGMGAIVVLASVIIILSGRGPSGGEAVPAATKLGHEAFARESDELARRMRESNLESSFTYLRQAMASAASVARDCHPLLHQLGFAAYEHYGGFAAAMVKADEMCNSGYVHGVVEANFAAAATPEAAVAASCGDAVGEDYASWQCFHGMGHGMMYLTQKDIEKSLDFCDGQATSWARDACANGAYMDYFIIVSHSGETVNATRNTRLDFCGRTGVRHQADCYYYAPTAYLEQHTNGYEAAFDWCDGARKDYVGLCITGVGGQAMKDNVTEPAVSAKLCNALGGGEGQRCAQGAISIYMNHHGSSASAEPLCGREFKKFDKLCRATIAMKADTFGI